MQLVLFDQAVAHVLRVCRVLRRPGGHALLVGVGGSGKQSMAKLAAFMCGYATYSPKVSPTYTLTDFVDELVDLFKRASIRPATPLVLLISDGHVWDERMLVHVCDLLSCGVVTDLMSSDEVEAVVGAIRGEAKAMGVADTRESLVRSGPPAVWCPAPPPTPL
jgi:dynein heavy chain